MPEIGNNTFPRNISIRISADGFSFFCDGEIQRHEFDKTDVEYYRNMAFCLCEKQLHEHNQHLRIYFDSPYVTLMPHDVFSMEYAKQFLAFCYEEISSKPEDFVFVSNPIIGHDIVNLFAVPTKLHNFLQDTFGSKQIQHSLTPFISQALKGSKKDGSLQLWLNLSRSSAYFILCDNGELKFANRFDLLNETDILYYTGLIYERHKLSQQTCPMFVTGNDNHTEELRKHVKYVTFIAEPCA